MVKHAATKSDLASLEETMCRRLSDRCKEGNFVVTRIIPFRSSVLGYCYNTGGAKKKKKSKKAKKPKKQAPADDKSDL